MDIKLQELIKEFALENERPKADKFKVTEAIRNYGRVGEALYKTGGILEAAKQLSEMATACLLYTSPSPRDATLSRMPSSA